MGVMSLTLAVPQGDIAEAEANQVGKEKTISSYGLASDRLHATVQRGNQRRQGAAVDPTSTRLLSDGKTLSGPTRRRLNIQAPIRRLARSINFRARESGTGRSGR
jgi:hypothetical protein